MTNRWAKGAGWVLVGALAAGAVAADTGVQRRWVITVDNGKEAGEQTLACDAAGECRGRFLFKDNGRGPEIDEVFRLADDGSYASYRATGATTFGSKVDERFSVEGGKATWASSTEQGEDADPRGRLYVPFNGSVAAAEVMFQAAAKRGNALDLLPSGRMTQREVTRVTVGRGEARREVALIAQTGLGLTPSFGWVTTDAQPQFFGFIVPGYLAALPEGYQADTAALTDAQRKAESEILTGLATKLSTPMPGLSVIRNARVFDSAEAKLADGLQDVYILRGRIAAVLPAGSPGRDVQRSLDAGGRVLLPGLFDMHGHVGRWEGGLNLAAGVTTVRDMGSDNATLQQIIDETAQGAVFGPRIVPAGFLEGESAFSARNGFVVSTLDEAKAAVDWYAEHGYPQIKVYNSFPRQHLRETVAYAHSRGLRVSGHVPAFLRARTVVEYGFDEVNHVNQVLLNFLVNDKTDTRTLERFYLPAARTAEIDFDGAPVQDFIKLLVDSKTVVDPTLATFDFLRHKDGTVSPAYAAVADHFPPAVQRGFRSGGMNIPDDATQQRYEKSYLKMIDFIGRLHRAGVPIVAGTDAMAGFTLQRELELYTMAGIPANDVLQIATRNGARYSGLENERGRIATGYVADLVLVEGDPTQDITALRRMVTVVTQGKHIEPAVVHRELGIKPFVDGGPRWVESSAKNAREGAGGR
jgi:imidazolonepropionase-like amidohydrolase